MPTYTMNNSMAHRSLDSERPIMTSSSASKRMSQRYSLYSGTPSFTYSDGSNTSSQLDTAMAEIKHVTQGLDRLDNKQLQSQRFVPSQKKTDDLSQLALAAKIQRAVGRRMSDQDATLKEKETMHRGALTEKPVLGAERAAATC